MIVFGLISFLILSYLWFLHCYSEYQRFHSQHKFPHIYLPMIFGGGLTLIPHLIVLFIKDDRVILGWGWLICTYAATFGMVAKTSDKFDKNAMILFLTKKQLTTFLYFLPVLALLSIYFVL